MLKSFIVYLIIPFIAMKSAFLEAYHATLRLRKLTIRKQVFSYPKTYFAAVKRADVMARSTNQSWHVIEFASKEYIAVSGVYLMSNPKKVLYTAFSDNLNLEITD